MVSVCVVDCRVGFHGGENTLTTRPFTRLQAPRYCCYYYYYRGRGPQVLLLLSAGLVIESGLGTPCTGIECRKNRWYTPV